MRSQHPIGFSALDSLMARDKKVRAGERLWVLLEAPGRPVIQSVQRAEIEHALSSAQARWRSCG